MSSQMTKRLWATATSASLADPPRQSWPPSDCGLHRIIAFVRGVTALRIPSTLSCQLLFKKRDKNGNPFGQEHLFDVRSIVGRGQNDFIAPVYDREDRR